ncbi:MAG: GNAT family N-acetyltransferase [Terriglobales bacterium]
MDADHALRRLTGSDLAAIYALDQRCFAPGIAYSTAEMRAMLLRRGFHAAIEAGGELGGFILTEMNRGHGHVITLDVAPEHRRRGLGLALMRAAEDHYRATGARGMSLEVAVNNAGALAFYTRLGYRVARRLPGYYARDLDALRLEKPLADAMR